MSGIDLEHIKTEIQKSICLVLGDAMLDRYIYGEVERISPEAPIPVVTVKRTKEALGGAANVAANIRHLGCETYFSSVVGMDSKGTIVNNILLQRNISYCGMVLEHRITTTKNRIIGKGQQIVRFDEEISVPIDTQIECFLLNQIDGLMKKADLVVISDYAKGVCTPRMCSMLISRANASHVRVIVDPKGDEWGKYSGAYVITPNWKEFTEIAGTVDPENDAEIRKKARDLLEEYHIENLLITRSERGMTLVSKEFYLSFPAQAREVADVSGAGDTALAVLAAFLATGTSLENAVYWANRAAGLAVERMGTSVVGMEELCREQSRGLVQEDYSLKIMNREEIMEQITALKKSSKKIIFTNGCFDILHAGHIQYLNEAKKLGDFLIVAVNTDQSVKRLSKGEDRPVNGENDRARQLAALQMVDAVVLFGEDTPEALLKQIRPDILVKGGDYCLKEIVGKEYAGETKVLSLKEGYSTTRLIEKIRCGV